MRFRKLRIAFSATCLIACVLLDALWVRSYYYSDALAFKLIATGRLTLISAKGELWLYWHVDPLLKAIEFNAISSKYDLGLPATSRLGFGFTRDDDLDDGLDYWGIGLPNWFILLFTAIFVRVPWLPWSKRFSLRTLLIATTLVAVVLGLIVYAVRK